MPVNVANEFNRLGVEEGDFIEVDVKGVVLRTGRKSGFTLGRYGYTPESALSTRLMPDLDFDFRPGPLEVECTVRGWYKGWVSGHGGAGIWVHGNGSQCRISVFHIEAVRLLSKA